MLTSTLAGMLLSAGLCGAEPSAIPSDSLAQLYSRGKSFAEFLAGVQSRRDTWTANYAQGTPNPELLARARAVPGRWRMLVVADDWCGDSANTIPYLARLLDSLSSVELRIVSSAAGRWVMEGHRTPDGRAATPTVILLDESGTEAGCFVERPAGLRAWVEENKPKLTESQLQEGRDAWRRQDAGQSTVREIVELLELAARRTPRCTAGASPGLG